MKKVRNKPRNPIARVIRKLKPKVVPDKRRQLRDRVQQSEIR